MSSTTERISILRLVGLFAETPDDILADVAVLLKPVEIPAGNAVVHKGDPGDCLYIIVNGRVRVHDGQRTLNFLNAGDVFGEMAVIDRGNRSVTAKIAKDAILYSLKQKDFNTLVSEKPRLGLQLTLNIVRIFSARIRSAKKDYRTMLTASLAR